MWKRRRHGISLAHNMLSKRTTMVRVPNRVFSHVCRMISVPQCDSIVTSRQQSHRDDQGSSRFFHPFVWSSAIIGAVTSTDECENDREAFKIRGADISQPPPLKNDGNSRQQTTIDESELTIWSTICSSWTDLFMLAGAVVSAFGASISAIMLPPLMGKLLDSIQSGSAGTSALVMQIVVQFLANAGLSLASHFFLAESAETAVTRLKEKLYRALLYMDISAFDVSSKDGNGAMGGKGVELMLTDVQLCRNAFKHAVRSGVKNIVTLVGGVYLLLGISPQLTFTLLGSVPLIVGIGSVYGFYLRKWSRQLQRETADNTAKAREAISNIRTVRAFNNEDFEHAKFKDSLTSIKRFNVQLGTAVGMFFSLSALSVSSLALVTLGYGGHLLHQGALSGPGDLSSFLMFSAKIQIALGELSLLFSEQLKGRAAFERIKECIYTSHEYQRGLNAMVSSHYAPNNRRYPGSITFSGVKFAYPSRPDSQVFTGLSFTVPAQKVTALVGPSGSGKSTIVSLLERFYAPSEGHISIDGTDIQNMSVTAVRDMIGMVEQEPVLFSGSIQDNIRYGRLSATDEEVAAAAKMANCEQFIAAFPDGMQTQLGSGGASLSGGQKQRVAIARAILRDPRILVLDEATSALDSQAEAAVQEALSRLMKGRTTLVIAHRLSTVRDADVIVVLHAGKVAEKGTHEESQYIKNIREPV